MNDQELRDLQELAYQLEELTRHPGWSVFKDFVVFSSGGQASKQRYVLNGKCKDDKDYMFHTGWIAGSQFALDAPDRVAEMSLKYAKQQGVET